MSKRLKYTPDQIKIMIETDAKETDVFIEEWLKNVRNMYSVKTCFFESITHFDGNVSTCGLQIDNPCQEHASREICSLTGYVQEVTRDVDRGPSGCLSSLMPNTCGSLRTTNLTQIPVQQAFRNKVPNTAE